MTPYLPIDYTAVIDMELIDRFLKDRLDIIERVREELPESVRIELEFDHDETGVVGLVASTSIDHLTFEALEKLRDGLALDMGREIDIVKTIYSTIREKLSFYDTPQGLEQVDIDLKRIKDEDDLASCI